MLQQLLNLVAPIRCVLCAELGSGICATCRRKTQGGRTRIGRTPVHVAGMSRDFVQVVVVWKDQRAKYLTSALAELARSTLPQKASGVLVPIPARKSSLMARGWSPLGDLATALSACSHLELDQELLQWQRQPFEQRNLSDTQRQANMRDAFVVTRKPTHSVWLLDDVMTSGATLRSAINALEQCNIHVQGGIVLAAPRIGRNPQL
ncbi:MAG: hypothetical protein RIS43_578 [Actinomycetota bacterium]